MALFGNKLKSELKQLQAIVQRQTTLDSAVRFLQGTIAMYPDWKVNDYINSYATRDQVFSVVNLIAETALSVPRFVYYEAADEGSKNASYKLSKITTATSYTVKSIIDIKRLERKALVDAPASDVMLQLLSKPNDYQNESDFTLSCLCFYLLKECFIYKYRLNAGANEGKVKELIPIPPQNVNLIVSTGDFTTVKGYQVTSNGKVVIDFIPPEDMIHWKRFNPAGFDMNGLHLRGLSPLETLRKLLIRIDASDDITTAQLQNGGLPGIVYDDISAEQYNKKTQEALDVKRQTFYSFLTNRENKGAPWFTGGKLGYLQTGLKLVDMMVAELDDRDFKRICNVYKVSDILFNNNKASTESNVELQTKRLYTNAVLPLLYSFYRALAAGLANEFPDRTRVIMPDGSAIPELQTDFAKLATQFSTLPGGFKINEIREAFGWDREEDVLCDKIIVKQGYSFIEYMQGDMMPDQLP